MRIGSALPVFGQSYSNAPLALARVTSTVRVKGDLHVNGDVYDRHGSLDRLRGNYNAHVHSDPQGGSVSTTTAPDPE